MNGRKRFGRRPGVTFLWLAALTAAVLLLATGSGVFWSVAGLQSYMDQHFTSIAVLARTDEQEAELEEQEAQGGLGLVQFAPTLSSEELEQIGAMEQVRLVDLRGLTAAYSPSLVPVLSAETEKAYQTGLDKPYGKVMLVGRVLQAETKRTPQEIDTTELDGQVYHYTLVETSGLIAVEQVVCAHESYEIPDEIRLTINYVSENPDHCIREGNRYLFYGEYDADLSYSLADNILESGGQKRERTPNLLIGLEDGVEHVAHYIQEDGSYRFVSSADVEARIPTFTPLEGSLEHFLAEPENELWQKTLEEMSITLHSLPLLGTNCLESVYAFQQGSSYIVQGRSFTQQEYRDGAAVCVISEAVAQKSGLSVGDTLSISQYEPLVNDATYLSLTPSPYTGDLLQRTQGLGTELNNPFIRPYLSQYGFATQEDRFTVVGIYRQETWWDLEGAYAMTPNVMFAPSGALADCAYQEAAGGVYLSVVLENGAAQDFEAAAAGTGMASRWLVDDQNYTSVKAGVDQLRTTALILLAACLVGWLVVMMFYLVLYQGGERRNLGIMISVGAGKKRAVRYLFGSGLVLAALGTVLGVALGLAAERFVLDMVMSVSMEQASATAMSSGSQIDVALIAETLAQGSAMSWPKTVLIAVLSVVILAMAMLFQALALVKRRPRKLMEG